MKFIEQDFPVGKGNGPDFSANMWPLAFSKKGSFILYILNGVRLSFAAKLKISPFSSPVFFKSSQSLLQLWAEKTDMEG